MQKKFSPQELRCFSNSAYTLLSEPTAKKYLLDLLHEIERCWLNSSEREQLLKSLEACLSHPLTLSYLQGIQFVFPNKPQKNFLELKHYLSFAVPIERFIGKGIVDSDFEVFRRDRDVSPAKDTEQPPLYLIADNIRSAFNIGSLFRTAECLGVSHIYLCGYSSTPEAAKTAKSAMGTEKLISWSWHSDVRKVLCDLKSLGIYTVALETAEPSVKLYQFQFPSPLAIIVGNEHYGIDTDVLLSCDNVVRIPVYGSKNSLNVAVAFAAAGYEVLRQWKG